MVKSIIVEIISWSLIFLGLLWFFGYLFYEWVDFSAKMIIYFFIGIALNMLNDKQEVMEKKE